MKRHRHPRKTLSQLALVCAGLALAPAARADDRVLNGVLGLGAAILRHEMQKSQSAAPQRANRANRQTTTAPRTATSQERAQIRKLQSQLNMLGFDAGTADGVFGQRTRLAIASFQRSLGHRQTGELTLEQRQILEEQFYEATSVPSPSERARLARGLPGSGGEAAPPVLAPAFPSLAGPGATAAPGAFPGFATPGAAQAPGAFPTLAAPGAAPAPGAFPTLAAPGAAPAPGAFPSLAAPGAAPAPGAFPSLAAPGAAPAPGAFPTLAAPGAAPAPGTFPTLTAPGAAPAPGAFPTLAAPGAAPASGTFPTLAAPDAAPASGFPALAPSPPAPAGGFPTLPATAAAPAAALPPLSLPPPRQLPGSFEEELAKLGYDLTSQPSISGLYLGQAFSEAGPLLQGNGFVDCMTVGTMQGLACYQQNASFNDEVAIEADAEGKLWKIGRWIEFSNPIALEQIEELFRPSYPTLVDQTGQFRSISSNPACLAQNVWSVVTRNLPAETPLHKGLNAPLQREVTHAVETCGLIYTLAFYADHNHQVSFAELVFVNALALRQSGGAPEAEPARQLKELSEKLKL